MELAVRGDIDETFFITNILWLDKKIVVMSNISLLCLNVTKTKAEIQRQIYLLYTLALSHAFKGVYARKQCAMILSLNQKE